MKKVFVLVLFAMAALSMTGQIDLGVKAGLNISNFKTSEILTNDYSINSSASGSLGYHAGAFMRASLFGLFIQPELIFTSISSEFVVEELATTTQELAKQNIGRIDMPVIIGAKLGNLRVGLGPVGSIIVNDNSDLKDISGYEEKIKSATIGYQLGAGFDIWKIVFDFRYESNLSKLGDYIEVDGVNEKFDSRAKQIIFSMGFRF